MAVFSAISAFASWIAGYVFTGLAGVGMSFSTALAIGKAAGYLVTAAAYSALQRALAPKINIPRSEIQAVIQQSDAPRRIYVGQNLAGGLRALFEVRNAVLYQLVVVQHGALTAFDEFWIDGVAQTLGTAPDWWGDARQPVSFPSDGNFRGFVNVVTRDGSGLGADYPILRNTFYFWNAARRLDGQATFLVGAKAPSNEDFMKIFPKAHQTVFQWVIRGQAVYDPRSNATAYSDNAALVIAHYLTHPEGYRLDPAEVDWESVTALADWCDLPLPQLAGGTAPMMRLWGYWTLDEEPAQVLERMRVSSGIRAYETQAGKIGLIGGPFGETACTLTAKDISQIQTSEAINEREGFNTLRVSFLSAGHKYEMTEVDAWIDQDRVAAEGEIAQELLPEMCPNQSQARRLAKRAMHDGNRAKVEIITNLVGLKARYPAAPGQRHTILLDYRPEDGSGRVIQGEYEVLDHEFDPQGLECRLDLARVDRASDAWDRTEEGSLPAPLPNVGNDGPPPISATLTQRIVQVTANRSQATLEVEAAPIAGRDDLTIEAHYQEVGGEDDGTRWIAMPVNQLEAVSGVVADGARYRARVRFRGSFAGVDEWHMLGPITIRVNATPPAAPTELIASPGTGYVHLSWRNPASNFEQLRVYRGTSASAGSAVLVAVTGGAAGQISELQDASAIAGTPYWYWVRAANVSGLEGPAVGPAEITL